MPPSSSSSSPGPGLKTVLIIDDDVHFSATLTLGLESHGYRTLSAPDATVGWKLAHEHLPDLILCDIDMPSMDGRRLLQEMRADPVLADRQFVLMTGKSALASPRSAMDLGADDLLLKPFGLAELLRCVAARLQRAALSRRVDLRVVEQLRESLHSNLPQEFFAPLASIIGLAEMLESQIENLNKDEIRQDLGDIRRAGRRLHRALRNYLLIIELETPESSRPRAVLGADAVVAALVTGIKAAGERRQRSADVVVELTGAVLKADPMDLTILAEELVDNALAFSRKDTAVRVRAWPEAGRLHLSVTDAGRGLTPEQLTQLGAFRQTERKAPGHHGLGLGVALVRKLARHLGGDIRIESVAGKGTTCHVDLPIHTA
ncbi:MAG TPA: response regulator [Opitutaceae bacterium]|nr:response regulator [Opitutaceae bacterium]